MVSSSALRKSTSDSDSDDETQSLIANEESDEKAEASFQQYDEQAIAADLLRQALNAFETRLRSYTTAYSSPGERSFLSKLFFPHPRVATVSSILSKLRNENPDLQLTAAYLFIVRVGIMGQNSKSKVAAALQAAIDVLRTDPDCNETLRELKGQIVHDARLSSAGCFSKMKSDSDDDEPSLHDYLKMAIALLTFKAKKEIVTRRRDEVAIEMLEKTADTLIMHYYSRQTAEEFYARKADLLDDLHGLLTSGVVTDLKLLEQLKGLHASVCTDSFEFDEADNRLLKRLLRCFNACDKEINIHIKNLNPIVIQVDRPNVIKDEREREIQDREEKLTDIMTSLLKKEEQDEKQQVKEVKQHKSLDTLACLQCIIVSVGSSTRKEYVITNHAAFAAVLDGALNNEGFWKLNHSRLSWYGEKNFKKLINKIKDLPPCKLPESLAMVSPAPARAPAASCLSCAG